MSVARCQSLCHFGADRGVAKTWGKELKVLGSHLRGWESPFPRGQGSNGGEILASCHPRTVGHCGLSPEGHTRH